MRRPKHANAYKALMSADDDMRSEGYMPVKQRQAVPPNDWDNLIVSQWRGQAWSRNRE